MFKSLMVFMMLAVAAGLAASAQQGSAGAEQEAKLIAVLRSDAPRKAKADACRELGRIGTRAAVSPLAALLDNEELSHMARYGLEPIPDPAVDDALRQAMDKLRGKRLVGVISSVGVRRDPKAIGGLAKKLEDPDAEVAQAAARALGRIGTLAAAEPLEKSLSRSTGANRLAVCEGLLRCADALRVQGQRKEAQAIYEQLRGGDLPEYISKSAAKLADSMRPGSR
jgi:HEAT repeat protein